MALKFSTEQKGQTFLVVSSLGDVRGRFKTKGEADVHAKRLQQQHNDGIERVSGSTKPPVADQEEELDS